MKFPSLLLLVGLAMPLAIHADEIQGLIFPFKEVSVSSPVLQDVVKDIQVDEGDVVKKGDILAHLLNDKEAIDAARYENLIKHAQFQYDAMKKLADENYASKDQLMEKETDLNTAKLDYQLALAALNEKTITSPLSGIVVKRYKEQGEAVDRTEKLFDIVDIDQVYLQVYLEPAFVNKLAVGDKVAVHFPNIYQGSQQYQGKIAFIDPRIDLASGLFRVKILIDNPNHIIKAGMRAEAEFDKPATTAGTQ
jgi:membrane fusion protein, multidrug efflux system